MLSASCESWSMTPSADVPVGRMPLVCPWLVPWLTGKTVRPVSERIAGEGLDEVLLMLADLYAPREEAQPLPRAARVEAQADSDQDFQHQMFGGDDREGHTAPLPAMRAWAAHTVSGNAHRRARDDANHPGEHVGPDTSLQAHAALPESRAIAPVTDSIRMS